jgi:carboxyl-terminal processing protease
MIRKASLLFAGVLLGAAGAFTLTQTDFLSGSSAAAAASDTYRQLNLFGDVFERVRADYVETPDDGALIESAINGMLSSLDPHSSYLSPKNFKDMQVQTSGKFGGLGIEVTMEDGIVRWCRRSTTRPPPAPGSSPATSSSPSTARRCRA